MRSFLADWFNNAGSAQLRWHSGILHFEHCAFALRAHFASRVVRLVTACWLSHIKSGAGAFPDVQFSSGPLFLVSNIGVCSREYPHDAHYPYDDERAKLVAKKERDEFEALLVAFQHTSGSLHVSDSSLKQKELQNTVNVLREVADELMPSQCHYTEVRKSPYDLIQEALAKGDHFSFQPRKPIFHWSGDGVLFLREKGDERAWVVFLVQAAHDIAQCSHEECKESHHIAEACRKNLAPLPSNITDVDGKVHTLRYVKIVVTADPIEHESKSSDVGCDLAKEVIAKDQHGNSASSIGSDLAKKVIAECFMDVDTIKKWCPTVGMFAGLNLAKIRQLAGAP